MSESVDNIVLTRFRDHGYAIFPRAASHLLEAGLTTYRASGFETQDGFLSSARDSLSTDRVKLDRQVKDLLSPVINDIFGMQRTFVAGVLHKGSDGAVPFHQDLTYTDERYHRSITCWMPLIDVDAQNGAMRVVPFSHRWTSAIRPAGAGGGYPKDDLERHLDRLAVTLPMPAGSLLCWDNALFHSSAANIKGRPRAALAASFIATDAELLFYFADTDRRLSGYLIDDRYLSQPRPFTHAPIGYRSIPPWTTAVDEHSFDEALWRLEAHRDQLTEEERCQFFR